jgi:plastocyanin
MHTGDSPSPDCLGERIWHIAGMHKCLTLIASTLAVTACGSSTAPAKTVTHSSVINANTDLTFTPSPDTIAVGDTAVFAWHAVPHNVVWDTSPAPVPNIGDDDTGFTSGDSVRVLTVAGTYTYHCEIHDGMDGVIVVK